jgi:KipI family sensor histidine kinase inhibitor
VQLRPVGRRALMVELADLDDTRAWYAALLRHRANGDLAAHVEIVPAARTVLLDGLADVAATVERLHTWPTPEPVAAGAGELVEIPVRYDGPDLQHVAALWGESVDAAVTAHCGTDFVVAFCGFAPGFAYLTGLPQARAVPRLSSPRTWVPAGSVGLAGPYCGVYPSDSPGGWQLIGHTDVTLWDLNRPSPALLTPGTRVRFAVQR